MDQIAKKSESMGFITYHLAAFPSSSNLQHALKLALNLHNLLTSPLISLGSLHLLQVGPRLGICRLREICASSCRHERETHQDICGRELLAAEIVARGRRHLAFQEGELRGDVAIDVGIVQAVSNAVGDGFDEEWDGRGADHYGNDLVLVPLEEEMTEGKLKDVLLENNANSNKLIKLPSA